MKKENKENKEQVLKKTKEKVQKNIEEDNSKQLKETLSLRDEEVRLMSETIHAKDKEISDLKAQIESMNKIDNLKQNDVNQKIQAAIEAANRRTDELQDVLNIILPFNSIYKKAIIGLKNNTTIQNNNELNLLVDILNDNIDLGSRLLDEMIKKIEK